MQWACTKSRGAHLYFSSAVLGTIHGSYYLAFHCAGTEGTVQPSKIQRYRCRMLVFTAASLYHLRSYIMNGIRSIHTTVFPILNTPGVICSVAEMEIETGQRFHFQQWNIWFCPPLNIAFPNPLPLLSIIHFQLNGSWRISPFAQWNVLKALLARQLKGHVYFSRVCIFHLICW